jgi:DNA polymerase-3 subunit alpha
MAAGLEEAFEYGARVQREKLDPQMGLFDMTGTDPQRLNTPILPAMDEWDEKRLLINEKESLGFYISGHPLSRYEQLLDKYANENTLTVKEHTDGYAVRIGGIVRKVRTIKTKRGELMAFVLVEDLHGTVEVTVFSSVYTDAYHLLVEDSPIFVQGSVQKDENAVKILADAVIPIDKAEEAWTASIHFNLDLPRTERETLETLRSILSRHPGSCKAFLHLIDPEKTETIVALPESLALNAGSVLTNEINAFLGYSAVETLCSDAAPMIAANGSNRKGRYRNG